MKYSGVFPKASKAVPSDSESVNSSLLARGGFIHKEMAGIYSFLPLGTRVLRKIQDLIREEMVKIGSQEIILPAISSLDVWKQTGREGIDVLYHMVSRGGQKLVLNPTTEEIITPLVRDYIKSHRDLPLSVFQIIDKFRDELRAKSGILRGREFNMKDGYSFHRDQEDLDRYYDVVTKTYHGIFDRLGIGKDTVFTYASGGDFSDFSHEFQAICPVGEDTIFHCDNCNSAVNREIISSHSTCPKCNNDKLEEKRGVEVGNIFKLGTRFSTAFHLNYKDEKGLDNPVVMGCYGIGPTRTMGTIVELSHDDKGIIWPESVAPFSKHMFSVGKDESVVKFGMEIYEELKKRGIDTLYDDRKDVSNGEKFATADLLGIPERVVISKKLMEAGNVEVKKRKETVPEVISMESFFNRP